MQDVVIIGSGCAGYAAAIYAARAELAPVVYQGHTPGGQLVVSFEVENYPGFPELQTGQELIDRFRAQAERFGATIKRAEVEQLELVNGVFKLSTSDGEEQARAVVAATGAVARRLPIASEPKFYGKGVSGCATCDGAFFRDRDVLVIGGGNTAMEDAQFMTRFASSVTIVHRRDYFRAAPVEVEKTRKLEKVKWMIPYVVEEILGDQTVSGAVLRNNETGETKTVECQGIFVAIGHEPQTELFKELVELDDHGYVKVDEPSTRTKTPGLFACGDVMDPVYKQAVTAAGTGCRAALDAQKYLESLDA
jgi:thioredoxin reductase (NADPH)